MNRSVTPPQNCANCGAEIPRKALACPECGADERTGWRDVNPYDGVDFPEADAESQPQRAVNGLPWYWWAVGVALLAGLAMMVLRLR